MSVSNSRTRLEMLTKELLRQWSDTKTTWRDAKAQDFERLYLQELTSRTDKACAMIDKLDALLKKVKDDCE